ncbi:ACP S-malonyltransferase [Actinomadura sp. WMMA1423]|uniref:acyltransferase domain-containing protein n=1 Tax=Actinomadura sp. WMMA1423 TaxID=2591108 RepID=UPI00143DB632|nr:ACP S-malonyltransferase [Actinomadura sp. WMMA1423]
MSETEDVNASTIVREARPEPRSAPAEPDQDHLLLPLDARTPADLRDRVAHLIGSLREPASGGLGELAAALRRDLADRPVRAAVVAASAGQARERLATLAGTLRDGEAAAADAVNGVFAGRADRRPAIGFIFPGQGSDNGRAGRALTARFQAARDLYRAVPVPAADGPGGLETVQPRIVASSVAGVRVLSELGIEASVAAGHSLGELTALHWAGALGEPDLVALAAAHGRILADACDGRGAMAVVGAARDGVEPLLRDEPVVIAGDNNPVQTVVSGPAEAVARVRRAAAAAGLRAANIPVSDAFHSPKMAPATDRLRAHLEGMRFRPLGRRVVSTVTGDVLAPDTDLRDLLVGQLCSPVLFSGAVRRMGEEVDLLLEVGPGQLLTGHAARICPGVPVVPLVTDGDSVSGLLCAVAAAYVLGAPVRLDRAGGHRLDTGPAPGKAARP